mgnify:CR=1 FL=1
MNFDLWFREQLTAVSQWIVEELDRLYAAIAETWNQEHTEQGGHGAITCTSIAERSRTTPMGEWIAIPFLAANFSGNGSMTWTVELADQVTAAYTLVGTTMTLSLAVITSTVGGTPNTALFYALPAGFKAPRLMHGAYHYVDNGVAGAGMWAVGSFAGSYATNLELYITSLGNWTASTNLTAIRCTATFEVVLI